MSAKIRLRPRNVYLAKANAAMLASQTEMTVLVVAMNAELRKLIHNPP